MIGAFKLANQRQVALKERLKVIEREVDVSHQMLIFHNLSERHIGVTAGLSAAFAEAASVCLGRHYASPQQVRLRDGNEEWQVVIEWQSPDRRTRDGWANTDDATEYGAYGLALAAVELTRRMFAVRRAETRTGADYYLAVPAPQPDDLEASVRLEVSGTDQASEVAMETRLREKVRQAEQGSSNLPAIAAVVGFAVTKSLWRMSRTDELV